MSHIKLSIVIPCHNEGEGLRELMQTYAKHIAGRTDVEVIIVNDASTDQTHEILDGLNIPYPFLKTVTNTISKGYGNAILSGLKVAHGEWLGWTHGDTQTPPEDVFTALALIEETAGTDTYFKGLRYGRPFIDQLFTFGMSILETLYLRTWLWDINAQPNIFHRSLYVQWKHAPKDFSLDLFSYYTAKKLGARTHRFPVHFGPRIYGTSTWNTGMKARLKFIKRTILFSRDLKKLLQNS